MTLALQLACFVASMLILWRAEPALNRMTCHTHIALRLAVHLLCVAAVAQVGAIFLFAYAPTPSETIMTIGVALLLLCERRLRVLVPPPRRPRASTGDA